MFLIYLSTIFKQFFKGGGRGGKDIDNNERLKKSTKTT